MKILEKRVIAPATAEWVAYADEKGLSNRRPKEAVVQPGHRVTVVGTVARRPVAPGGEAGSRDGASAIWLVGDFDRPLLVAPAGLSRHAAASLASLVRM